MKFFAKALKRQDGFTLVELMVVVAIIGLLSAVAIPNFKKYQAKSKTSEAKLQLSAAYTAQQSFYSDFNIYHHCLGFMGFNPANEIAQRYFMVGIDSTSLAAPAAGNPLQQAVDNGLNVTACPTALTNNNSYFFAGKLLSGFVINTLALFTANAAGAASDVGTQAAGAETFVIGAVGAVDSAAANITGAGAAGFTINQNKIVSHVVVGY
jgi:type IV pilus assembly protein PilA